VRAPNLIIFGLLLLLAGCAANRNGNEQVMKIPLGDNLLCDTNAAPGSVYEVGIYVIAPGDTVTKIANRFQTSVADLMAINPGLKPTRLYIGQKVRVYERKKD
jgi:hypothetical protein